ncbi:MAG: hypothetical protein KAH18_06675 [Psychromonas sp.]|nr:hypothetical protein [Psychromonas sp.]
MMSNNTESIDRLTKNKDLDLRDDASEVKLVKIPDWLKNTLWSVGAPFNEGSHVSVNTNDLSIDISDDISVTGLSRLSIDTKEAEKVTDEQVVRSSYTVAYSTALDKQIEVRFLFNEDKKSAEITFLNDITLASFNITKHC